MAIAAGTVLCAGSGPASADAPAPINATANGNAVAGGLSFQPANITGAVGQTVTWRNTDAVAPHTVTEDHGLFDLVGNNVNGTPVSDPGFGPGTSVSLVLSAGTATYYCKVHPGKMNGVLAVPVTLALGPGLAQAKTPARTAAGRRRRAARRRAFQRTLTLTWAAAAPADGEVFDVQQRRGGGAWTTIADGTSAVTLREKAGRRGTVTAVRARLRLAADARKATGWSPEATVTG